MSRLRITALTALALLPALVLLYVSGSDLLGRGLMQRTSTPTPAFVWVWVGDFAVATMGCASTILLAVRGTPMSKGRRIALATPALLPALIGIAIFGIALSHVWIIALKDGTTSSALTAAFVAAGLIVVLLSGISTIVLAWRSERKPSLDSVF
jgi:hypothetical protein